MQTVCTASSIQKVRIQDSIVSIPPLLPRVQYEDEHLPVALSNVWSAADKSRMTEGTGNCFDGLSRQTGELGWRLRQA